MLRSKRASGDLFYRIERSNCKAGGQALYALSCSEECRLKWKSMEPDMETGFIQQSSPLNIEIWGVFYIRGV